MATSNIETLAANLGKIIQSALNDAEKQGSVQQGTLSGTSVIIDGRTYTALFVVDIAIPDGSVVYAQVTNDGAYAAIVGR